MQQLMLHCGGQRATREEVFAVPTPAATDTWFPVGYQQIVEYIERQVPAVLDAEIVGEDFGLNRNGSQLFGVFSIDRPKDDDNILLGIRQSLDRSMSLAEGGGRHVFLCDNMMFTASSFMVLRKNTKMVWEDFMRMTTNALAQLRTNFEQTTVEIEVMREIQCTRSLGYEILGRALGDEVISPTQGAAAFREWRDPQVEDKSHSGEHLFGLCNAFTEGLKKGAPGQRLQRQVDVHRFFQPALEANSSRALVTGALAPV